MECKKLKRNTSFDDLPDEVQVLIFKLLTTQERRNIALVSKTWQECLQAPTFMNDYILSFYDCLLHDEIAPITLFRKSTRKFRKLYLGPNVACNNFNIAEHFLKHIGRHVLSLEIHQSSFEVLISKHSLTTCFPELQELVLYHVDDIRWFESFPETLTKVHLKHIATMHKKEDIDSLKQIKNLKTLTSDSASLGEGLCALVAITPLFKEISTTIFEIRRELKAIFETMNTINNLYINFNVNFLEKPQLKEEDVLGIQSRNGFLTFRTLNKFKNLRSLEVSWETNTELNEEQENQCFFGHDIIYCPKLESLELDCLEYRCCLWCFRTMINSFPNLKSLTVCRNRFHDEHVKHLCNKLSKLKYLELKSQLVTNGVIFGDEGHFLIGNLKELKVLDLSTSFKITKEGLNRWPSMPKLNKIKFGPIRLPLESTQTFVERCPNILHFEIENTFTITDAHLEIMTRGWPNLQVLQFSDNQLISKNGWIMLKRLCKNLRYLKIVDPSMKISFECSFFEEIPALRKFMNGVRSMFREDCYFIDRYIKAHRIPHDKFGDITDNVSDYSNSESDEIEEE